MVDGGKWLGKRQVRERKNSSLRFMEVHRKHWPGWEGESEVRQMFGPDDEFPPGKR